MRLAFPLFIILIFVSVASFSQTNIICTNPSAEQVMKGNYDPAAYSAATIINHPDSISRYLQSNISPDSLKSYIQQLQVFHNRNTGSDTVSNINGIGAARRWAFAKFQTFSAAANSRLLPFYLQFDLGICNAPQHRNICAVLPGADTSDKSILIVEAHIDSRCEDVCDTACFAQGMEDNGSGTALVLEFSRVMSHLTLNHTIVFMLTIGEEQGLDGANAMATYVQQKGIQLKAVLNNDIVGGIICGVTSSAPSCPGLNDIDSTNVRLFSYGGFNSLHKQFARFTKLEYKQRLLPIVAVPMAIQIMTPEDRLNRGGDHIPFRQKNYTAIRMTSANENGDAMIDSTYTDRQHTSRDILGVDAHHSGTIDSFYVDFDYLARNTAINGNALAMAAIGPSTPGFTADTIPGNRIRIEILNEFNYASFRVGIRTLTNDWDSVYYMTNTLVDTLNLCDTGTYFVSVATMDFKNVESLFSHEVTVRLNSTGSCAFNDVQDIGGSGNVIELLQNKPNPFDEATTISIYSGSNFVNKKAYISITDINGKQLKQMPVLLKQGINEVLYRHGFNASGTYFYTLYIDGKPFQSRRMTFAN
ncbi:MAG: hypothetical protein JWO06_2293 [Bacteroidota bacterium]|nr:hypothetical protein [Bacteroidota bacterium]